MSAHGLGSSDDRQHVERREGEDTGARVIVQTSHEEDGMKSMASRFDDHRGASTAATVDLFGEQQVDRCRGNWTEFTRVAILIDLGSFQQSRIVGDKYIVQPAFILAR